MQWNTRFLQESVNRRWVKVKPHLISELTSLNNNHQPFNSFQVQLQIFGERYSESRVNGWQVKLYPPPPKTIDGIVLPFLLPPSSSESTLHKVISVIAVKFPNWRFIWGVQKPNKRTMIDWLIDGHQRTTTYTGWGLSLIRGTYYCTGLYWEVVVHRHRW